MRVKWIKMRRVNYQNEGKLTQNEGKMDETEGKNVSN